MSARIAVVGLPFFAERATVSLREAGYQASHLPRPGRSPVAWARLVTGLLRTDLVYAIGSSPAKNSPVDLAARRGAPVLMHWVGTDVVTAIASYKAGRLSDRLARLAHHWADAPWLVEELAPLGINAEYRPLPIRTVIGEPIALPPEFRVLIYFSARPHRQYDLEGTMAVIRSLPDVAFTLVGGYRPPGPPPNLEVVGFVEDMAQVYPRVSAFLRLTHHDGMSHSVIEALSFGRYVFWNYSCPGVTRVADAAAAIEAIRIMQSRFIAGTLEVNEVGAAGVTQRYRWDTLLHEVQAGIDQLLS